MSRPRIIPDRRLLVPTQHDPGVLQPRAGKYTGWTGTALGGCSPLSGAGSETRQRADKAIVLMSDGHANKPTGNGPGYARTMAAYVANKNIKIYTISLGDAADVQLMEEIAEIGGGQHFDATGSGVDQLS